MRFETETFGFEFYLRLGLSGIDFRLCDYRYADYVLPWGLLTATIRTFNDEFVFPHSIGGIPLPDGTKYLQLHFGLPSEDHQARDWFKTGGPAFSPSRVKHIVQYGSLDMLSLLRMLRTEKELETIQLLLGLTNNSMAQFAIRIGFTKIYELNGKNLIGALPADLQAQRSYLQELSQRFRRNK